MTALRAEPAPSAGAPERGVADSPRLEVEEPRVRCPAPIVAVASGKGGVGKTCISIGLAGALASEGWRITLVDADLGMANADVLCNLTPRRRMDAIFGTGSKDLSSLAVETSAGFRLVPGASNSAGLSAVQRRVFLDSLSSLAPSSDAIVMDTAAGMSEDVLSLVEAADVGVIVATPEPTSMTDAYAIIKCLARRAAERASPPLAVVINQASSAAEAQRAHERIAAVADRFLGLRIPLLGAVPLDDRVRAAVRARQLIPGGVDGPAGVALKSIASKLAAALRRPKECTESE